MFVSFHPFDSLLWGWIVTVPSLQMGPKETK